MSGFIGRLFGSPDAINTGIKAVTSGLDALVYTKEEQAADQAKSITEARGMLIDWIKSSQGSNLARRIIALSVTFSWLLMYIVSMGLNVASVFTSNATDLQAAAGIIGDYADGMNGAVMMVLLYYFAAPHMGQGIQAALDKFGKKTPTVNTASS